jgi:hypothetical protein
MHQFDPGDRNGGVVPEAFEAEHDVHPRFDVAMIPVDPVFRYLDDFSVVSSGRSPSTFISRAARWDAAKPSGVIVSGASPWLPIAFAKNTFAAATAPGAEPAIDRPSCPVNCTIKADLTASNLHIRLVNPPRIRPACSRPESSVSRHARIFPTQLEIYARTGAGLA